MSSLTSTEFEWPIPDPTLVEDWKITSKGLQPVRVVIGTPWQEVGPPVPLYKVLFGIEGLDPSPIDSAGVSPLHATWLALQHMMRRLNDKAMGGIPADRVWPPP